MYPDIMVMPMREELTLPDAKQTALLRQVTDAFIKARLLTANEYATAVHEISSSGFRGG